jgi:cell division ATPase FtsA
MRGVCGIDIDRDKIFVSFAALGSEKKINFLREVEVDSSFQKENFLEHLRRNSENLNQVIEAAENELSLKVERIFLNLPRGVENRKQVEDVIPLKRRKRIAVQDLMSAKKYLADIFLDWDDFCVHHFVLNYEIGGDIYRQPPIGKEAKKIKIKSLLVWIKDRLRKEAEDIFDNLGREFGGFVSSNVSIFSTPFTTGYVEKYKESAFCVINIGYENTRFVVYKDGKLELEKEICFGSRSIEQAIEKRFFLNPTLAKEVFLRYTSFKNVPYFKEVSIKKGNNYINLSIQALNSFVREYIKNEVNKIIFEIKRKVPEGSMVVSFIGRLNIKEGYLSFLKSFFPQDVKVFLSTAHNSLSSSFGCLKYGVFPFWENYYRKRQRFFQRFLNVYKEYF